MANNTSTNHFECDNCGANLKFNPATGNLWCEFCKTEQKIHRKYNPAERDYSDMNAVNRWRDSDVKSYRCENCGATSTMSANAIATSCPFCKSPVVVDESCIDSIRPDTLLPFEVTVDSARENLLKWRRRRFWAPNKYKKSTNVEEINGIYTPIWTFDFETHNVYSGTVGVRRTRTKKVNGKTVTETYIHYFHVEGEFDHFFNDILYQANEHIEHKDFAALTPVDMDKYVEYDDDYIAGFGADNYTLDPKDVSVTAENYVRECITQMILDRHNATVVGNLGVDVQFRRRSFKYLMMPVYVTASHFNNKLYNNYVAGSTFDNKTKVSGAYPVSSVKVALFSLLMLVIGAFIVMAYLQIDGQIDLPFLRFLTASVTPIVLPNYASLGSNFSVASILSHWHL